MSMVAPYGQDWTARSGSSTVGADTQVKILQ